MADFTGLGLGTIGDPYQITTTAQYDQMNSWGVRSPIFTGSGINNLTASWGIPTKINCSFTVTILNTNAILGFQVYAVLGGTGYVVNDTFSVDGGLSGHSCIGTVLTVDVNGAVLTIGLIDKGSGYSQGSIYFTTATSGIGSGLRIRVNSASDICKWKKDNGVETTLPIVVGNQTMSNSVYYNFATANNHTIGDVWLINVDPISYFKLMNNIDYADLNTWTSSIGYFYSILDGNFKEVQGIRNGIAYYTGIDLKNDCTVKNITFRITSSANNYEYTKERIIFNKTSGTPLSGVTFQNIKVITSGTGTLQWLSDHIWDATCIINNIVLEGSIHGVFVGEIKGTIDSLKVLRTNNSLHWADPNTVSLVGTLTGIIRYSQHILLNLVINNALNYNYGFIAGSIGASAKIQKTFVNGNIAVIYVSPGEGVTSGFISVGNTNITQEITDCYFKGTFSVNGGNNTSSSNANYGKSGFIISQNRFLTIARCITNCDIISPLNNNRSIFTQDIGVNITNCFYNKDAILSITPTDVINRQSGLTTSQYAISANFNGFDFNNIWQMGTTEPELRNNPIYAYETPITNCQITTISRLSNISFSVPLLVNFTNDYGVEIYKNNVLFDTKINSVNNTIITPETDGIYECRPYYNSGGTKHYGTYVSYTHYADPKALITPTVVAVTNSILCEAPYPAKLVHGSILYNGYIYGVTRNVPFPTTHGVLVKTPVHNLSGYTTIPIKSADLADNQFLDSTYYSASMEQIVECGGYLYFLFSAGSPISGSFLCQYDPIVNDYKVFRNNYFIPSTPIVTDGQYLYFPNYGTDKVYKVDPNQFIGAFPKWNVEQQFNITFAGIYDASSQGGYIGSIYSGYTSALKGECHSACADAEYLYISYTTDRLTQSGYYAPLDISTNEVHKIRKNDMTAAGFCKIPKSTDDMTQNATWLFYGIEVQATADTRAYGYGWGSYAVKKADMTIRGLPRLHSNDNPPTIQSYGSLLFGNYLIDIKTNFITYVLDITDVENWSINENIGKRLVTSFSYTGAAVGIYTPFNEILQQSDGTFYAFQWAAPSSLSEFSVPSLNLFSVPTISTLNALFSGTTVTLNGFILSHGGKDIIERGFKWGITTGLTNTTISNQLTDSFNVSLSGLSASTYFYSSYATNSEGISVYDVKLLSYIFQVNLSYDTLCSDLGPTFNLTSDVGIVTPSVVSRNDLITGILITVDSTATQITVTSNGVCINNNIVTIH